MQLRWWAALSLVAGCSATPAAPTAHVESRIEVAAMQKPTTSLPPLALQVQDACQELEQAHLRERVRVGQESENEEPSAGVWQVALPRAYVDSFLGPNVGKCHPNTAGAWFIGASDLSGHRCQSEPGGRPCIDCETDPCVSAQFSLHFLAPGVHATLPLDPSIGFYSSLDLQPTVLAPTPNGDSTLLICKRGQWTFAFAGAGSSGEIHGCLAWRYGRSTGAIRPFEVLPYAIERIEDVNGDGYADLISPGPYDFGALISRPSGEGGCTLKSCPYVPDKPFLLAAQGAGDGGFSFENPVSRKMAHQLCPSPPKPVVIKQGEVDKAYLQTAHNVVCARLWNVAADSIRRELKNARKFFCIEPTRCPEMDVLEDEWTPKTPPLVLTLPTVVAQPRK